ncbi:MAG: nucleoside hydrolase [Clostridia bacterium]|nr:nucleoside hydrolase [Clostridia bacterium]
MRKFIIDTDTAADDAVALLIAAAEPEIEILGVTTVCGNVPLELATKNALQVLETAGRNIPVFKGESRPLKRELYTAEYVHGSDGMGDKELVNPKALPQTENAVDFILNTVKNSPDEIEIIALGPVTNIAKAILDDPETMRKIKKIWSMGTAGLGKGNVTEYAEFNVYVDAESYDIMLNSGIPITVIGLDMCLGESSLNKEDLNCLANLGKKGSFVEKCTSKILEHNIIKFGSHTADIPDAVAVSVCLWKDTVKNSSLAFCRCVTDNNAHYGQVEVCLSDKPNTTLVTEFNANRFKERLINALKD